MRSHTRSLGPAVTATAIAALLLLVVLGNTDMAIRVAAAAVLVGMFFLRRYAREQLVYDDDSTPAGEVSVPSAREREIADEGTIADLADRMRGRF